MEIHFLLVKKKTFLSLILKKCKKKSFYVIVFNMTENECIENQQRSSMMF